MTMGAPPRNVGPVGFDAVCTISVPTVAQDSTGAATYSDVDQTNVPCCIQASAGSEAARFGGGVAFDAPASFVGFFPMWVGDGTAVTIPAKAKVTSGGTVYAVQGAASEYADGIQRAGLVVRP